MSKMKQLNENLHRARRMDNAEIALMVDAHSEQNDALDCVWLQARSYHYIDNVMDTNLMRFMAPETYAKGYTDELHNELEEVEAAWDRLPQARREELASYSSMVSNGLEGTEWFDKENPTPRPAEWA